MASSSSYDPTSPPPLKRPCDTSTRPNPLIGITIIQYAFHFLEGPAIVLHASTANRRWRELATGEAVWRVKFEREGMREKAGLFEVPVPGAGGGGSSSSSAEEEAEVGRVNLAVYARVFALKVSGRAGRVSSLRCRHRSRARHRRRAAGVQDDGRGLLGVA